MTTASDPAAPQPFVANSLSASLTVSDLTKSLAWYRDVMGFTVAREFERAGKKFAASLRAGTMSVLLTQDDGARGSDRPRGEGFSLQFTTSQPIDEMADRIKALGTVLDTEPFDAFGARAFRLRDPDGFKLVISSERSSMT